MTKNNQTPDSHLSARVETLLVDHLIGICSEEVEAAVAAERPPLGVDDHLFGLTAVPVPRLYSLQPLHVTRIGACAWNMQFIFINISCHLTCKFVIIAAPNPFMYT